jgi:tRNA pseudouridine38-40 synthase
LTIQQLIESAIFKSFKQKIKIFGASRTDAGVNASGQVFHFDINYFKISNSNFITAINNFLPDDIKILKITKVAKSFNARYSAKKKIYKYTINTGAINPIESSSIYQYNKKLSIKKIKQCCKLFIGKKKFLSFSTDARDSFLSIREIYKI